MAPARRRRAWYSVNTSAILRSWMTEARSVYSSASRPSFLAAEMVACTDRGGNALGVHVQVPDDVAGEAHGIRLVVDGEHGRVPQQLGVPPEDAHAGGVEGGDPHLLRHRSDQAADALLHLPRGLVGEGDGQDLERGDVVGLDEVGDAVGQHPGLARTGPGHHQQGPSPWVTASYWAGFRPSRRSSALTWPTSRRP